MVEKGHSTVNTGGWMEDGDYLCVEIELNIVIGQNKIKKTQSFPWKQK